MSRHAEYLLSIWYSTKGDNAHPITREFSVCHLVNKTPFTGCCFYTKGLLITPLDAYAFLRNQHIKSQWNSELQNIDPVNEGTVYPCLCCLPVPLHKDDPVDMTAGTVQVAIKLPTRGSPLMGPPRWGVLQGKFPVRLVNIFVGAFLQLSRWHMVDTCFVPNRGPTGIIFDNNGNTYFSGLGTSFYARVRVKLTQGPTGYTTRVRVRVMTKGKSRVYPQGRTHQG